MSLSLSTKQHMLIITPNSNLLLARLSPLDIPPAHQETAKLSVKRNQAVSISPRNIYHPAVQGACQAMFTKHPSNLTPEEVYKFNC